MLLAAVQLEWFWAGSDASRATVRGAPSRGDGAGETRRPSVDPPARPPSRRAGRRSAESEDDASWSSAPTSSSCSPRSTRPIRGLVVKEVLDRRPRRDHVLVVDDGSATPPRRGPARPGPRRHQRVQPRRGRGHAGGLPLCRSPTGFRRLVQVDADGQHDPRDIAPLLAPLDDEPAPGGRSAPASPGGRLRVPRARRWAMRLLAAHLSRVTGTPPHRRDVGLPGPQPGRHRALRPHLPGRLPVRHRRVAAHRSRGRGPGPPGPGGDAAPPGGSPSQSTVRGGLYLLRVAHPGACASSGVPSPDQKHQGGRHR